MYGKYLVSGMKEVMPIHGITEQQSIFRRLLNGPIGRHVAPHVVKDPEHGREHV